MRNAIEHRDEFSSQYSAYSYADENDENDVPVTVERSVSVGIWTHGLMLISIYGDKKFQSAWIDNKEALRDLRNRLNAMKLD